MSRPADARTTLKLTRVFGSAKDVEAPACGSQAPPKEKS